MKLNTQLAIASLAVAFFSVNLSVASAGSLKIRLDNVPSPSDSVPSTQTTNNICVYAKHTDYPFGWDELDCRALTTVSSSQDYCLEGVDHTTVTQIKITIDGNNAFWLDKWQAYYYAATGDCTGPSPHLDHTYGIDNNVGYCFSTDSGDYSTGACTSFGTVDHTGSGPSYSALVWDYVQ